MAMGSRGQRKPGLGNLALAPRGGEPRGPHRGREVHGVPLCVGKEVGYLPPILSLWGGGSREAKDEGH